MALRSTNPANKEIIGEIDELSRKDVEEKLSLAQKAYEQWRAVPFSRRSELMGKVAAELRGNKTQLGRIMTGEMGKTLPAAEAEVEKSALACDFYGENAEKFLSDEYFKTDGSESYARFDPIGVVLAVMPWNFPFWQVFRFAAPALMAGNVGVLKHASNVQQSAQAIEDIFTKAGMPEGVFQNLAIGSSKVEAVIKDSRVKAVTLTGSEYAGSQVAMVAGKEIKKTVLELGGSDPFIVLEDADIDQAAQTAVATRLQLNAGQSCISAKRFIVKKEIAEQFTSKVKANIEKLKVGDPTDPKTDVGPLSSEQTLLDIEKQVDESIRQGAKVVAGGKRGSEEGYFYLPTLMTNIKKGMPVYDEEVFGPVMPIIVVNNDQEAIDIANSSQYGLAATIFSSNADKAKELAAKLESGAVFINGQVKSDPRLPFGGIKKSGYGRELSHYGIKEFVNIKTVWVK
jgi:succinate-semialdehyde dehydrogenase/glutarate-semialdehyde dehydrogenase